MYLGDIRLGETLDFKFTSRAFATGVPTTLAGTPSLAAYVGNGTTEITAGITLTVDLDGVDGLNNVRVVASGGNGFATATNVDIVIAAGEVDGVSVIGEVVGSFSIEARSALMPTTAARTLDVASTGEAGVDFSNILTAVGAIPSLGISDNGTAQAASGSTITLRSAAAFADNTLAGQTIYFYGSTQGYWQSALIASNVLSTDVVTISPNAGYVTPSGTITYFIALTAAGAGTVDANVVSISGDTTAADNAESFFDGTGYAGTNNVIPLVTVTTTATNLTNAATAGDLTATMKTSVTTAAMLTALTEAYAADGAAGTGAQLLYGLQAFLQERAVSGTTLTVKKLDGSTTAMTFTLNDATTPTALTRAT